MAEDLHLADEEPRRRAAGLDAAPLSVIWPLLGRHIAFHRRLVDLTASVKAALLLSQSVYWTRHGRDIARTGGWFHKSAEQWETETGLSAKEQAGARELLRGLALLEDQRTGVPARLHFRLNVDELGRRLAERIASHPHAADWSDRAVLAALLGPSVAFYRTLAGIAGGVHAGLLLSRAMHLTRLQAGQRLDHWIASPAARWFEEIGLSRREQEAARRDLVHTGLWEECSRGIPPSLMARIRLDCLLALLTDDASAVRGFGGFGGFGSRNADPDRGVAADKGSPKGETRPRQTRSLVSTKAPSQFRQNRHHSFDESAISIVNQSTRDLLQPQYAASPANPPDPVAGGGEWVFPEQMLPDERQAARLLLRPCGDLAQSLLDELAGRLQVHGVRLSPVAYLRGLIARAAAGRFVPELGPRVAAERERRQKEAIRRLEREAEEQRLIAERATPEYEARALAQRQKVSQVIDELKARLRTSRPP